nr:MAG TPA: hypothetical protein [Caudoviricetes sp.]
MLKFIQQVRIFLLKFLNLSIKYSIRYLVELFGSIF